MIGPAFMANETLGTRLRYRWNSTKAADLIHRLKVRAAERRLKRVERALALATYDINRFAIVSRRASAIYRAAEAFDRRMNLG